MKKRKQNLALILFLIILTITVVAAFFLIQGNNENNPQKSPVKKFILAYSWEYSDQDYKFMAENYDLIILHENHYEKIWLIREFNPNVKILVYKFSGLSSSWEAQSAHGYSQIIKTHPDWFLFDTAGNKVTDKQNSNAYMMNFGNKNWQEYAAKDYLNTVKEQGWDGVFLDVVHTGQKIWDLPLKNYGTQKEYDLAVYSFIDNARKELESNGFKLIFNGISLKNTFGELANSADYTSGVLIENFANNNWGNQISSAQVIEQINGMYTYANKNKYFLAVTHENFQNETEFAYGFTSYLLGAGENCYFYVLDPKKENTINKKKTEEIVYSKYYNVNIGSPKSSYTILGDGTIQREFSKGFAAINPTEKSKILNIPKECTNVKTNEKIKQVILNSRESIICVY